MRVRRIILNMATDIYAAPPDQSDAKLLRYIWFVVRAKIRCVHPLRINPWVFTRYYGLRAIVLAYFLYRFLWYRFTR